ncbi:hypothetical protein [Micromonospora maris]|uniref:hypothetical protein n=1 Tax=Micromonospora maris TaxID=1003110 RepID=UPI001E432AF6|nr:hypothetical protein [Micromonospora maris]
MRRRTDSMPVCRGAGTAAGRRRVAERGRGAVYPTTGDLGADALASTHRGSSPANLVPGQKRSGAGSGAAGSAHAHWPAPDVAPEPGGCVRSHRSGPE